MQAAQEQIGLAQYLTCFVAGEEYAIGVLEVKEILEYQAPTIVPGTPAFVRGVINLRGSVVPVIDLAAKLGLPQSAVGKRTCIVIVDALIEGHETPMGIMVDAVSQVIEIAEDDIEPPPTFGPRIRVGYLQGMVNLGEHFALLLHLERLLSAHEAEVMASIEEALAEAEAAAEEEAEAAEAEELDAENDADEPEATGEEDGDAPVPDDPADEAAPADDDA